MTRIAWLQAALDDLRERANLLLFVTLTSWRIEKIHRLWKFWPSFIPPVAGPSNYRNAIVGAGGTAVGRWVVVGVR